MKVDDITCFGADEISCHGHALCLLLFVMLPLVALPPLILPLLPSLLLLSLPVVTTANTTATATATATIAAYSANILTPFLFFPNIILEGSYCNCSLHWLLTFREHV